MRSALGLAALVLVLVLAMFASCADNVTGNGVPCVGVNCATPTPPPTSTPTAAPALLHVPTFGNVGKFDAGTGGTVTTAQVQEWLTLCIGNVPNGADRCSDTCVHGNAGCYSMSYEDFFRLDNTGSFTPGWAMVHELGSPPPAFSEASPHPWVLHTGTPQTSTDRTQPKTNIYNVNFNEPQTSTWWQLCLTGNMPASDTLGVANCNGVSPHGAVRDDNDDYIYSDTSSTDVAHLTGASTTVEIANDTALQSAVSTWIAAAALHGSGKVFPLFVNGMSDGAGFASNGQASCQYVFSGGDGVGSCGHLLGISAVHIGDYEFCGQNLVGQGLVSDRRYIPFCVNSATYAISLSKSFDEDQQYESGTYACPTLVGTSGSAMLMYQGAYLLTYNPSNPTAQYSNMDVDRHASGGSPGGVCSGGGGTQGSSLLSVFPVQTIVPTSALAIGVSTYTGGTIGIAGCAGVSENDSGGIIPYLVTGTCDSGTPSLGVYGNASAACNLGASGTATSIGACAWFINLGNVTYNTSLCTQITTLGVDLSKVWGSTTFQHQADIGQSGGSATLADMVSGGTITVNSLAWACATPNIPSGGGVIVTP